MKIGVLSDTHLASATDEFRRAVVRHFGGVDMIIHAGDMTSMAVFDYLANWKLLAVRGNMDDYDLAAVLPEKRIETIAGKRIGIMHGRGSSRETEDIVFGEFPDVDIIIFGHSHVPLNARKKGVQMFNPGTYRGSSTHRGTIGIIEIGEGVTFTHVEL